MFIVLEGLDGSGTTSQTQFLMNRLTGLGYDVVTTREPSGNPIGVLIRGILTGRHEDLSDLGYAGWIMMTMLFSADRVAHVRREIEPWLNAGKVVICDRYYYSTLAYQLAMSGANLVGDRKSVIDWIQSVNSKARRPDLSVILDVPVDVVELRILKRGLERELLENRHILSAAARAYRHMPIYFPRDRVAYVDAGKSMEEVTEDVVDVVLQSGVLKNRGESFGSIGA